MPRQTGPIKMTGFIDGKIHYEMNGVHYVRNPSAPSKSKINNDPAFIAQKNNSRKFGVASAMGTVFKKSFEPFLDNLSDKGLHNRICSLFNQLIQRNQNKGGVKSITIRANRDLFQDFQFKEGINFDNLIWAPHALKADEERKSIKLVIPSFNSKNLISEVTGATHFKIILSVLVFSDYIFDVDKNKYLPLNPDINRFSASVISDLIPLKDTIDPIALTAQLSINNAIPETVGLVSCIGIEFYQQAGGKPYLLEMRSCMKIGDVF